MHKVKEAKFKFFVKSINEVTHNLLSIGLIRVHFNCVSVDDILAILALESQFELVSH